MTEVLGRPVSGEINKGRGRIDQWPGETFIELLDEVLNQPNVESVKWTQYTPYFNDGEPCIFGVHTIGVKLVDGDPEDGDYEDGYVDEYSMFDYVDGDYHQRKIKPDFEDLYAAFIELSGSLDHFENFLEDSFGDHARVIATKDGFDVEFYDHE